MQLCYTYEHKLLGETTNAVVDQYSTFSSDCNVERVLYGILADDEDDIEYSKLLYRWHSDALGIDDSDSQYLVSIHDVDTREALEVIPNSNSLLFNTGADTGSGLPIIGKEYSSTLKGSAYQIYSSNVDLHSYIGNYDTTYAHTEFLSNLYSESLFLYEIFPIIIFLVILKIMRNYIYIMVKYFNVFISECIGRVMKMCVWLCKLLSFEWLIGSQSYSRELRFGNKRSIPIGYVAYLSKNDNVFFFHSKGRNSLTGRSYLDQSSYSDVVVLNDIDDKAGATVSDATVLTPNSLNAFMWDETVEDDASVSQGDILEHCTYSTDTSDTIESKTSDVSDKSERIYTSKMSAPDNCIDYDTDIAHHTIRSHYDEEVMVTDDAIIGSLRVKV